MDKLKGAERFPVRVLTCAANIHDQMKKYKFVRRLSDSDEPGKRLAKLNEKEAYTVLKLALGGFEGMARASSAVGMAAELQSNPLARAVLRIVHEEARRPNPNPHAAQWFKQCERWARNRWPFLSNDQNAATGQSQKLRSGEV